MVRQRHRGWDKEEREDYYQGAIKETIYKGEGDDCLLQVRLYTVDGVGGWKFVFINRANPVKGDLQLDISKEMAWEILRSDPKMWKARDWGRYQHFLRDGTFPDRINDGYYRRRSPRCACR